MTDGQSDAIEHNIVCGRYICFRHHQHIVTAKRELKGKYKQFCMCHECRHFHPDDRPRNCHIANQLFPIMVRTGVTIVIWECPEFEPRDIAADTP